MGDDAPRRARQRGEHFILLAGEVDRIAASGHLPPGEIDAKIAGGDDG